MGEVILDDGRPGIELRPEANKSKGADAIDLPQELVDALKRHRPAGSKPTDLVSPAGVPSMKVHKRLLRKAGIDYEDSQKRKGDFHALRKTYNMLLARAGVPLQTRMFLVRHTDPKLTADTYADINVLNPAGVVQGLPRLMPQPVREELRATGTDGRYVEQAPKNGSSDLEPIPKP